MTASASIGSAEGRSAFVRDALRNALGSFDDDELAYLAATSKCENHVRDRLAWQLTSAAPTDVSVGREWSGSGNIRIDLTVLDSEAPRIVLQAKALYSFDVASTPMPPDGAGLISALEADLRTAHRAAPEADVFALVLCTDIDQPVPEQHRGVIKYSAQIDKYADMKSDHNFRPHLARRLQHLGDLSYVIGRDGAVFGLPVSVSAWLLTGCETDGSRPLIAFVRCHRGEDTWQVDGVLIREFDGTVRWHPQWIPPVHRDVEPKRLDELWTYFEENGGNGISWDLVGPVRAATDAELEDIVQEIDARIARSSLGPVRFGGDMPSEVVEQVERQQAERRAREQRWREQGWTPPRT